MGGFVGPLEASHKQTSSETIAVAMLHDTHAHPSYASSWLMAKVLLLERQPPAAH